MLEKKEKANLVIPIEKNKKKHATGWSKNFLTNQFFLLYIYIYIYIYIWSGRLGFYNTFLVNLFIFYVYFFKIFVKSSLNNF